MDITVTGRHMEVTPAIREYAAKKLAHIGIDFPRILSAHFLVEVQKYRQIAELVLHCANHITIEARAVSDDLYGSLDAVVAKVARQMRKHKTRIQRHRPRRATGLEVEEQVVAADLPAAGGGHRVVRTERFAVKPMFVEEAVLQLELNEHHQFVVFQNADTHKVNVLYRRRNGDYGLIQPMLG